MGYYFFTKKTEIMDKKYELTDESIIINKHTLYRIRALRSFGFDDVAYGDLGGFVESENNLSHDNNCWVYDDAKVYGNAQVSENAKIYNTARISRNARIYGNAIVFNNAKVYENARVFGQARLGGYCRVYGNAIIHEDALVKGHACIYGNAWIGGSVFIVRDVKLNSGVWNRFIRIHRIEYIISTTFKSVLAIGHP